jgi:integrase
MARKLIKSSYPGVRYREHKTRRISPGAPQKDRYFFIRYKLDGKDIEEGLGWASQTWTEVGADGRIIKCGWTEKRAAAVLAELQESHRLGTGPQTLREKRDAERAIKRQAVLKAEQEKVENIAFEEASEAYLEWAKKSKKDWDHDETRLNLHINPILGRKLLSLIDAAHIETLKIKCQEKGLAAATVRHCLQTTRAIFNHATRLGNYRGENPTRRVKFPKVDNQRKRFFTHDQAEALLTALQDRDQDVHDITMLGLLAGLRFSEIARLRWEDVDLDHDIIHVHDAKSGESREAYITDDLSELFLRRQKGSSSALIFPGPVSGKILKDIPNVFMRTVKDLNFNSGVTDPRQKLTFHSTRHTFGSWLALQGTPLFTIKELMGHKTIQMTERYSHLLPDHKREAVSKLTARAKAKVLPFTGKTMNQ